jgi:hypothetical protein
MSRVTLASIAFLVLALGFSGWLLTRDAAPPAVAPEAPARNPRAGLTFAEWSVRSDGVLLADIDPGEGMSTMPRRFIVAKVEGGRMVDGPSFSWALPDRAASAGSLFALGFRVSAEGRAFNPSEDPLSSDPLPMGDAGTQQLVTLRSRGGVTASFTRRRTDPTSNPYWGLRAIGYASSDGHLAYITPDAMLIPITPR